MEPCRADPVGGQAAQCKDVLERAVFLFACARAPDQPLDGTIGPDTHRTRCKHLLHFLTGVTTPPGASIPEWDFQLVFEALHSNCMRAEVSLKSRLHLCLTTRPAFSSRYFIYLRSLYRYKHCRVHPLSKHM